MTAIRAQKLAFSSGFPGPGVLRGNRGSHKRLQNSGILPPVLSLSKDLSSRFRAQLGAKLREFTFSRARFPSQVAKERAQWRQCRYSTMRGHFLQENLKKLLARPGGTSTIGR
jgi:hypothetical protein